MGIEYNHGRDYESLIQISNGDYLTRVDHEMINLIDKENDHGYSPKTHSQLLAIVKTQLTRALNVLMNEANDPDKLQFRKLLNRISQAEDSSLLISVVDEALSFIGLSDAEDEDL